MVKLNKQEEGRSMVEMLGVLAVIGVLSVAGIAGYSNAMKKHRANEILNEASKRAVLVAAQAMTGKTGEIALSEFGNNTVSGVTFSKAEIKKNHIVLTLSGNGIADNCAQLKTATGDNTVMKITKDDCSELTFNADMSVGTAEEGAENKCPAGGTYNETTGECVCEDVSSDSCCESGKSICVKEDFNTEECLEYSCCKTGKRNFVDEVESYDYFSCFPGCKPGETDYGLHGLEHVCLACSKSQIYCTDGDTDAGLKAIGSDDCVDGVDCCNDGRVYEYKSYMNWAVYTGCCQSENMEDCCPADVTCTWRED